MTIQTETNPAANGAEAPGAATSGSAKLEDLVKQFNEGNKATEIAKLREDLKPLVDYVQADASEKQAKELQGAITDSVSTVRKAAELPKDFDDELIEGLLHKRVGDGGEYADAWNNRHKDPEAWKAQLGKAAESLKKYAKLTSERSDVERAAASVRNVSTEPSKPANFNPADGFEMSERDWQKTLRKLGAA